LQTRFTPVIHFVVDQGVKNSIKVAQLINEALAQSAPGGATGSADGTAEEEAAES